MLAVGVSSIGRGIGWRSDGLAPKNCSLKGGQIASMVAADGGVGEWLRWSALEKEACGLVILSRP